MLIPYLDVRNFHCVIHLTVFDIMVFVFSLFLKCVKIKLS